MDREMEYLPFTLSREEVALADDFLTKAVARLAKDVSSLSEETQAKVDAAREAVQGAINNTTAADHFESYYESGQVSFHELMEVTKNARKSLVAAYAVVTDSLETVLDEESQEADRRLAVLLEERESRPVSEN